MDNLLEIKHLNLEAFYDDQWQPIVHDISLTLKRGKSLGSSVSLVRENPPSAWLPWDIAARGAGSPQAP